MNIKYKNIWNTSVLTLAYNFALYLAAIYPNCQKIKNIFLKKNEQLVLTENRAVIIFRDFLSGQNLAFFRGGTKFIFYLVILNVAKDLRIEIFRLRLKMTHF